LASLRTPPKGEATRIGETLAELRSRYAGRDLGAVVIVSDGIDTGRVGRGPVDGETRKTLQALGAPVHTVWSARRSCATCRWRRAGRRLRLRAHAAEAGGGHPRHRTGPPAGGGDAEPRWPLVDVRSVFLDSDDSEQKVSFDWIPDRPGNFVFEIATPVLAGEALSTNNKQVFTLKVIRDRVRVLHVCGRPSWDQRFLRSLLRLDPNVDLVSFFICAPRPTTSPGTPGRRCR
jgi:hypothetical protein